MDVTNEDQVKAGIEKAVKEWGRLDVLYANAGINGTLSSIEKFNLEDWNTTISTNLTGTFLTVKHAVPHLKKKVEALSLRHPSMETEVFQDLGCRHTALPKQHKWLL